MQGADRACPVTVPVQTGSPDRASVASSTTTASPFTLWTMLACGWSSGGASGPTGWTGLAGGRSVLCARVFSSPSVASRSTTVSTQAARSELLVSAPASLKDVTSALYAREGRSCEICPQPIPGVGRASAGTGNPSFTPRSAWGSTARRVRAGVHAASKIRTASRFICVRALRVAPGGAGSKGVTPKQSATPFEISSDVEVQRELHRSRPEPHRVQLLLHLVLEPGPDHVLGEDVALEQELVVALQLAERLLQRA